MPEKMICGSLARFRVFLWITILCFAFLFFSCGASAQNTTTITQYRDIVFGAFFATPGGGTVTISPSGSRTTTGTLVMFPNPNPTAASFTVYGSNKNKPVYITLPGTINILSGGNSMSVTNFTSNPSGSFYTVSPQIPIDLTVGATLNVGPGQPSGAYSGSFTVTVAYQ